MPEPTITVSGDANGWIVELHDGERSLTYTGMDGSEAEAVTKAVALWNAVPSIPPVPEPQEPDAPEGA